MPISLLINWFQPQIRCRPQIQCQPTYFTFFISLEISATLHISLFLFRFFISLFYKIGATSHKRNFYLQHLLRSLIPPLIIFHIIQNWCQATNFTIN